MSNQQHPEKFFYMNLKKKVSQKGTVFYTGKFAYAVEVIGFEKKDGSGDLTLWLQPKNMDELKASNRGYAPQPAQQKPVPQARPYPTQQQSEQKAYPPAHPDSVPWPTEEDNF